MTTTRQTIKKKGPRGYRLLVMALNGLFGLLLYWLLGFIMEDISNQPGPNLQILQKKYQDSILVQEEETINESLEKSTNTVSEQQQQLKNLEASIASYRDTMNQLLDLQKASIQKGVVFSSESQKNLHDVTVLYLNHQKHFQDLNNAIISGNLEVQQLQNRLQEISSKLDNQKEKAYREYNSLWAKHNWAMAGLQLLSLIPLLLVAFYLVRKYKKSPYKTMFITAGIAVFVKISMVMHNYFPSYLFKYLLISALIYCTAKLLVTKLRLLAAPNRPWIEQQNSEAYQKNQCPQCQFPIRPSIAKFFCNEAKNTLFTSDSHYLESVEGYTCPCCGQLLFNKCSSCSHLKYSLLSYCDSCGSKG